MTAYAGKAMAYHHPNCSHSTQSPGSPAACSWGNIYQVKTLCEQQFFR